MAEYYAVLSKAVAGLGESAESRRAVYDKARNALIGQLKAIDPPLPTAEISRQRLELEEAIRRVERETAAAAMTAGPKAPRNPPSPPPPRPVEPPVETVAPPPPQESPEDVFQRAVADAGAAANHPAPPEQPAYQDPDYPPPPPSEPSPPPPPPAEPPVVAYSDPEPPPQQRAQSFGSYTQPAAAEPQLAPDYDYEWESGNGGPPTGGVPDPFVDRRDQPQRVRRGRGGNDEQLDRDLVDQPVRRSRLPAILLTILILAMVGGLGAIAWSQRDMIGDLLASFDESVDSALPTAPATSEPIVETTAEPPKVADRLLDDNLAPDPNVRVVGPQQPDELANLLTTPDGGDVNALVAQGATLYEEPLDSSATDSGVVAIDADVRWTFEAAGASGPEVVADLSVPDRNMTVRMAIRKNTDDALPASHLVEVTVGGSVVRVDQVPRLVLKATEGGRGSPLIGAAAKVADGFFWIALSALPDDILFNTGLLRERAWIDLPLVYESGQRAILTFEKGTPGDRVLQQALAAWGG